MNHRSRALHPSRLRLGLLLGAGLLAAAPGARAGDCPVPLFREHSPSHPPTILVDAPVRDIFDTPEIDADPRPPGTLLSFYRVGLQTADPDPDFPTIVLEKQGDSVVLHWGGSGNHQPCCVGASCLDLCPEDCLAMGGALLDPGLTCADDPPPCGPVAGCTSASSPAFGLAKQAGGGVTLGGSGFPSLMPVELNSVNTSTGESTLLPLVLDPPEQRVWNFAGAQDPMSRLFFHAGGRANDAMIPATIVTVDTVTESLVAVENLSLALNLVHLDFDSTTGTLYGLAVGGGSLIIGSGNLSFSGPISVVTIDPATGETAFAWSGLPGGLRNYAATLDGEGRRYFYSTSADELVAVNLDDGSFSTVPLDRVLVDLQFDDSTGTLYGLETWGSGSWQGSGDTGYRTFGNTELLEIDPATGATTILNPDPLPTGTTNYASAYDCSTGHYLWVSDTGETQVLDTATGRIVATAPPPGTSRFHALD